MCGNDGQAVVTVVRNAPLDAAASVDYATQDGTATAGTDYQATSGTLNFAPGQSSATFTVPLDYLRRLQRNAHGQPHALQPQRRHRGYPHRDAQPHRLDPVNTDPDNDTHANHAD